VLLDAGGGGVSTGIIALNDGELFKLSVFGPFNNCSAAGLFFDIRLLGN
jgi:hypothetical protein